VLQEHGAVSQITAEEMARNVRIRFNADYGISITGIAGPDGGSEEKPVGMVWIAISDKERTDAYATRQMGGRADIRYRSSQTALTLLRDKLLFLEKKEEKVRENREKS
jgi:nicotinamide-nucleotide amidase